MEAEIMSHETNGPEFPEFPVSLPPVEVKELPEKPFKVDCRELGNWCIVPEAGRHVAVFDYRASDGRLGNGHLLRVVRPAKVSGIAGWEIVVDGWSKEKGWHQVNMTFCGRLTETHAQFLAVCADFGAERNIQTYLAPGFDESWGQRPRILEDRGRFVRQSDGSYRQAHSEEDAPGAGVYSVTIGFRTWKCLRVIAPEYDEIVVLIYLTEEGDTILQRHCCAERFVGEEKVKANPDSPVGIVLDGVRFVHWYDVLTHNALGLSLPNSERALGSLLARIRDAEWLFNTGSEQTARSILFQIQKAERSRSGEEAGEAGTSGKPETEDPE